MFNIFRAGTPLHPFRWFIAIAATSTLWMSYTDLSGGRFMSFTDGPRQRGYYGGGITGHK